MLDHRDRVAASIASAQTNLEQAMMELAAMSSLSYGAVAFAAHALNNYLSVVSGVTDLMGIALTDYPDPRVHTWLDGIQRSTRMMTQIVAGLTRYLATQTAPFAAEHGDGLIDLTPGVVVA